MTTDHPLITYIRVSTSQQGRSGLGIEAQRQALATSRKRGLHGRAGVRGGGDRQGL